MASPGESRPIGTIRLTGGLLCLNFVNTIHDRHAAQKEDYICTADRFAAWSIRAGAWSAREAQQLRDSESTRRLALREAVHLRESLYSIFSALAEGQPQASGPVAVLDRWLHRAWRGLRLGNKDLPALEWDGAAMGSSLPLQRIALSALSLLEDGDQRRLKRCALVGSCGWFFYDLSKANKRRWCSMDVCGTVSKMRRYRNARNLPA